MRKITQTQFNAAIELHIAWRKNPNHGKPAKFHKENLSCVSFYKKNLDGTSFNKCFMQGVDFSHTTLKNLTFKKCDLTGASFFGSKMQKVSFKKSRLGLCDFSNSWVLKSDFSKTSAMSALFQESGFFRCNFSKANLANSNFTDTMLGKSRFISANLQHCDLTGADFNEVYFSLNDTRYMSYFEPQIFGELHGEIEGTKGERIFVTVPEWAQRTCIIGDKRIRVETLIVTKITKKGKPVESAYGYDYANFKVGKAMNGYTFNCDYLNQTGQGYYVNI